MYHTHTPYYNWYSKLYCIHTMQCSSVYQIAKNEIIYYDYKYFNKIYCIELVLAIR